MKTQVLLVEDDVTARLLLADVLKSAGYEVTAASNGETAIQLLGQHLFDIVLADIQMGNVNGVQVLAVARSLDRPPGVILLTGYGSLETSIAALRLGADNYLLKPCEPVELLACIDDAARRRAEHLRQVDAINVIAQGIEQLRGQGAASDGDEKHGRVATEQPDRYIQVGRLMIDVFRHTIVFDQEVVHITPIEYELLHCLALAQGRVLSCSEIVRWTHKYEVDENEAQGLIKAHIRNLRRKIDPSYLVNVRGMGYRLAVPE